MMLRERRFAVHLVNRIGGTGALPGRSSGSGAPTMRDRRSESTAVYARGSIRRSWNECSNRNASLGEPMAVGGGCLQLGVGRRHDRVSSLLVRFRRHRAAQLSRDLAVRGYDRRRVRHRIRHRGERSTYALADRPRRALAHCFTCKKNLNTIDLLISEGYDFPSAVALLKRWLDEYQANHPQKTPTTPPAKQTKPSAPPTQ